MFEYEVWKRAEPHIIMKVTAEDGLEACSKAFPALDFEVLDVSGETAHLLDISNDVTYLAKRGAPVEG